MPARHTPGAISETAAQDFASAATAAMRAEGLAPYTWSNDGGYVYAAHRHLYHKVLFCTRGSIRFKLPEEDQTVEPRPGDRLDLAAGTAHAAVVGPDGGDLPGSHALARMGFGCWVSGFRLTLPET